MFALQRLDVWGGGRCSDKWVITIPEICAYCRYCVRCSVCKCCKCLFATIESSRLALWFWGMRRLALLSSVCNVSSLHMVSISRRLIMYQTLKGTSVSVCFWESVDCHLRSSFCNDSIFLCSVRRLFYGPQCCSRNASPMHIQELLSQCLLCIKQYSPSNIIVSCKKLISCTTMHSRT